MTDELMNPTALDISAAETAAAAAVVIDARAASGSRHRKRTLFLVAFLISLIAGLAIGAGALYAFDRHYTGRVLPGVSVGGVDLSGLTPDEAAARLEDAYGRFSTGRAVLRGGGFEMAIDYAKIDRRPDVDRMVAEAMAVGRSGNAVERVILDARTAVRGVNLAPLVLFDEARLARYVQTYAGRLRIEPKDAFVSLTKSGFVVTNGVEGRVSDRIAPTDYLTLALADIDAPSELRVDLDVAPVEPEVTTDEAIAAKATAEVIANDIAIVEGKEKWTIAAATVRSWISFQTGADGKYAPVVDPTALNEAVAAVAKSVEKKPSNASFRFSGSRITGVVAGKNGRTLDVETTATRVAGLLRARATGAADTPVAPAMTVTTPNLTTEEANAVAAKMRPISSFSVYYWVIVNNHWGGNIEAPASKINGTVVPPGEIFDFWKVVGDLRKLPGAGPGNAIEGGKITVTGAFGGGICTSSTTLFNAAFRAGMVPMARQNHNEFINRYPPGLDATVWIVGGTKQTMSFKNDTNYPILIQRIITRDGSKRWITFKIWSVPNGRTYKISNLVIHHGPRAIDTVERIPPSLWGTSSATTPRRTAPRCGSPCPSTTTANSTGRSGTTRTTQRSTASSWWGPRRPDAGLSLASRSCRPSLGLALLPDHGADADRQVAVRRQTGNVRLEQARLPLVGLRVADGRGARRAVPARLERRPAAVVAERLAVLAAARAPVGEQPQRRREVASVAGQRVLHPRRPRRVRRGDDDPLALEAAEPLGQDVRGDAGQLLAELAEAAAAGEQRLDEEQAPAIADAVEGGLEGTRPMGRCRVGRGRLAHGRHGRRWGLHGVHGSSMLQLATNNSLHVHSAAAAAQEHPHDVRTRRALPGPHRPSTATVAPSIVGIGSRLRGSGVVVADGQVLTNAHNLRGDEVTVTFADGRTATGTVAGIDVDGDLAVIEVDTAGATPLAWADGDGPAVGSVVFGAAATPGGGTRVTFGTVSGDRARVPRPGRPPDRRQRRAHRAAGARLVRRPAARRRRAARRAQHEPDRRGLLPGAAGRRGAPRPGRRARSRRVRRAGRGSGSRSRPAHVARRLRRSVGLPERDGVLVRGVEDDSPAAKAGIRDGDLIVEIAGTPVTDADELQELIAIDADAVRGQGRPRHRRADRLGRRRRERDGRGLGTADGRGTGPTAHGRRRRGARRRRGPRRLLARPSAAPPSG